MTLVADAKKSPDLKTPKGLVHDSLLDLLFVDSTSGELHRMRIADGRTEKLANGLGGGDGLQWDRFGRLYVSDRKHGKVFVIPRPGAAPIDLKVGHPAPRELTVDPWPFGRPRLELDVPCRRLPARPYEEVEEFRAAYRAAPAEQMSVTVRRAG